MKKAICFLAIVLMIFGIAYMVRAGSMSLDLGLELGPSGSVSACGTGFTQLTGSDSAVILDSTWSSICCPE